MAIILGVSSGALILSGLLIAFSQVAVFRRSMVDDLVSHTRMIANNCLAAVSFDDPEDASIVLQTLASESALAYATVNKADGSILTFYRREGFHGEAQPTPALGGYEFTAKWLVTREPILLDGEIIGTACLQSDLSELAAFRRQIMTIVFINLSLVFLVAWLLSSKLQKLISGPVERLTETVRDISSSRDYSIRATHISGDEVGVLAKAFNEMLSEVELRDRLLREREKVTQEYLDVARVMIVALDSEGVIALMNPKGCELLGLSEKDVLGKNWFETFIPERIRENVKKGFDELMGGEADGMDQYENEIVTGSGEERLIAWNNYVVRDETGRVVSVLSSGTDITDRKEAEEREASLHEQLSRAERMKSIGVLAGGVAHDLNNILGPMVALPGLIEEDMDSAVQGDALAKQEIGESLSVMKLSAGRASDVVRDLVALSRRGHYDRVSTDLAEMSCLTSDSECIRGLKEAYPDVSIQLNRASSELPVLASENHISRVVDNVIRNAVESIVGKGKVSIEMSAKHLREAHSGYTIIPPGHYAIIEVTDTGNGMEKEHLSRIFEPFYTKKRKTERSGSGLGLSVVHGIMEDHDGYIDVVSDVGVGTTFVLYLPIASADERVAEKADDTPLIRGTERVLVVDDEPGQRFLATKSLRRLGYTVDVAEEGRSAVRLFADAKEHKQAAPYDVIILDMVMDPDFDGLDTLKEVRELYPEQKVLIASGHAENDRASAALALGAEWLAKPYSVRSIARAIAELCRADKA